MRNCCKEIEKRNSIEIMNNIIDQFIDVLNKKEYSFQNLNILKQNYSDIIRISYQRNVDFIKSFKEKMIHFLDSYEKLSTEGILNQLNDIEFLLSLKLR